MATLQPIKEISWIALKLHYKYANFLRWNLGCQSHGDGKLNQNIDF